jgi:hypothetical protein
MLIQKVFHIRKPLDETQARLHSRNVSGRFCALGGFGRLADGGGFWDAMSMIGFRGPFDLELLPTDDKHQVLFHSTGAEVELCGLMELLPVRDHLTEVQLTLEYDIQSPLFRMLDRMLGAVNRRVNRQILEMKRQMEDEPASNGAGRFQPARYVPSGLLGAEAAWKRS